MFLRNRAVEKSESEGFPEGRIRLDSSENPSVGWRTGSIENNIGSDDREASRTGAAQIDMAESPAFSHTGSADEWAFGAWNSGVLLRGGGLMSILQEGAHEEDEDGSEGEDEGDNDDDDESGRKSSSHDKGRKSDSVKDIAEKVNKRLLKSRRKKTRKSKESHEQDRSAKDAKYLRSAGMDEESRNKYSLMEQFSYLGKFRTATNIYRNHLIEYTENKDEETSAPAADDTQDIKYDEFEEMIRVKKINDTFGSTMEYVDASTKEKWDNLKVFPFYRIMSMLRYSMSMT
ncbi:MAG: hypothetical protein R6U32_00990 [Candidatus Woesearchaeota archaeon]